MSERSCLQPSNLYIQNILILQAKLEPMSYLSPANYTQILKEKISANELPRFLELIVSIITYLFLCSIFSLFNLCILVANCAKALEEQKEKDELQSLKMLASSISSSSETTKSIEPTSKPSIEDSSNSQIFVDTKESFIRIHHLPEKRKNFVESSTLGEMAIRRVAQKTSLLLFDKSFEIKIDGLPLKKAPKERAQSFQKLKNLYNQYKYLDKGKLLLVFQQHLYEDFLDYEMLLAVGCINGSKNSSQVFDLWNTILQIYYGVANQLLSISDQTVLSDAQKLENSCNLGLKKQMPNYTLIISKDSDFYTIQIHYKEKPLFSFSAHLEISTLSSFERFYLPIRK